jgi:hypothetical protein
MSTTVAPGSPGSPTNPVSPVLVEEPTLDKSVLILYILILSFLGVGLIISLLLGTEFQSFSASIVTAMTTIAGFAIGVNSEKPE